MNFQAVSGHWSPPSVQYPGQHPRRRRYASVYFRLRVLGAREQKAMQAEQPPHGREVLKRAGGRCVEWWSAFLDLFQRPGTSSPLPWELRTQKKKVRFQLL